MGHQTGWIPCLVSCLLVCGVVHGTIDTVGHRFESESALDSDAAGVFLLQDIVLDEVVIFNFSAYCVRSGLSVWFQVYRPVSAKQRIYSLVGQAKLTTTNVPRYYQKRLYTQNEMIFTQAGDILGLYHEENQSPIAYTFVFDSTTNPGALRAEEVSKGPMEIGTEIKFIDIEFPYRFSVTLTFDTDVERYKQGGTGTLIPPTVPPTTRETIPPIPQDQGTLVYVGNPLTSRDSMMTSDASGTLYLLRHLTFRRGVVTSFYGYFVRKAAVWYQVWRPVMIDGSPTYMLVGQVRFQNQYFPSREEFKLQMGNHIFTEEGDVLGFMVETNTNPIGFGWIYTESNHRPLGSRLLDGTMWNLYPGFNLTFSDVELPQDFAVGAKYDTVPRSDVYGTPRPIVVTTTPATTLRTTTVPTLVQEPSIGKETIRYTSRALQTRTRKTFIIGDSKFPERGRVTTFYAYVVNLGRVQFQVWRKTTDNQFTLVGNLNYNANRIGYSPVRLTESEQIDVEEGDYLGYYNEDPDVGTIGYHFEASNLFYNDTYFTFLVDKELLFEQMPYPYKFAIAASYTPVSETTTPKQGETPTPRDPNAVPVSKSEDDPFGWLLNTRILLVMFVWLIVVTILFLIVCGIMLCRAERRHRRAANRPRPYSFTNPVTSSRPTSFSRWDDMTPKSHDVMDYFNPATGGPHKAGGSLERNDNKAVSNSTTSKKYNNNENAESNTHM